MSGSTIPLMGQVADPLKWLSDAQNILKLEADRYKVQAETETEKERPAQVRANAGLLGAQTGLAEADTGMRRAQTTGEQIKNELARLGLNYRTDVYQTLPLGGGNGQPAPEPDMPWSGAPGVTGADLLRGNRGGAPAAAPAVAATPPPAAPTTATPGTAAAAPTTAPNALAMYSTQAEPAAPSEVGAPALDETMKRLRAQQAAGGNQLADAAGAAAPGGNALAPAAPAAAAAPAGNAAATAEEEKRAARMRQPGPNGVMIDGVGAVPLGRYKAALLTSQGDIFAAQTKLGEERRKELFYLAQSATPETWNDNVRSAYSQGWLTKGEVDHFYNHPEFQDSVVRSLSSAETAVGYQSTLIGKGLQPGPAGPQLNPTAASTMEPVHGTTQEMGPDGKPTGRTLPVIIDRGAYAQQAIDRAKAAGERMVTVSYDQPGSDGRMYPTQRQVPASMVQQGGQGAPGAGGGPVAPQQGGAAGGGMPFDRYAELTHKIEGSGKNPRSTASGNYGFVDPTWAATVRKYAPDLAAGKTDEQINATVPKGVDPPGYPGFEARMLHAFTSDNAAALQAAGLPVNASSLHLAHRLGADGMRKLVTATAATPISAIASEEVLKANPEFRRMHVGNFVDQVMGTFGNDPVNLGPRTGGEALGIPRAPVAGPGGAPAAPAGAGLPVGAAGAVAPQASQGGAAGPQSQLPPGTMVGKPELSPEAAADLAVTTKAREAQVEAGAREAAAEAEGYGEQSKQIITAASSAPMKLERLEVLQNAASEFRPGLSADKRAGAAKGIVDALGVMGITLPDTNFLRRGATGAEVIGKEGGYLAAEMTKALGSREAASVFDQIRNIQPNLKMTEGGFQAVINSIRQGVVRDQQLGTFREQWMADPKHNNSIRGMMDAFNASHPIEAYASRVMPYPMPKSADGAKDNVIYRAPNGTILLYKDGLFHPAPVR